MDPGNRDESLVKLLGRLQGKDSPVGKDKQVIASFPYHRHARTKFPMPTRRAQVPRSKMEFLTKGNISEHGYSSPFPIYADGKEGLKSLGWSELSHGDVQLGEGSYGSVQLVFRLQDIDQVPEKRRLAAVKSRELDDAHVQQIWTELTILKSVRHGNIVDAYGAFVHGTEIRKQDSHASHSGHRNRSESDHEHSSPPASPGVSRATYSEHQSGVNRIHKDHTYAAPIGGKQPHSDHMYAAADAAAPVLPDVSRHELCLLIEYATAGDLHAEIGRYVHRMPELGALYYMKQIMSGLEHLHGNGVIHNELDSSNILLSYNRDGMSKRCMIGNFGLSSIIGVSEYAPLEEMDDHIQYDVASLIEEIMRDMIYGLPSRPRVVSAKVNEVLNNATNIETVTDLRSFAWFSEHAAAPYPGGPLTPEPHQAPRSLQELEKPQRIPIPRRSPVSRVRHVPSVAASAAPALGGRTSPPNPVVHFFDFANPQPGSSGASPAHVSRTRERSPSPSAHGAARSASPTHRSRSKSPSPSKPGESGSSSS